MKDTISQSQEAECCGLGQFLTQRSLRSRGQPWHSDNSSGKGSNGWANKVVGRGFAEEVIISTFWEKGVSFDREEAL